jgi:hypothetical protein
MGTGFTETDQPESVFNAGTMLILRLAVVTQLRLMT